MIKPKVDEKLVDEVLSRSVGEVYPSKEALRAALASGRRLRIYSGFDATGPHLHLGHLTNLLALKRFQKLGHEIIFLIGDFTAQVGDPTGKISARQALAEIEVRRNLKTFKIQAARVVKFSGENAAKVKFNSAWLKKMNLADFLRLASLVTHQQLVERDMFQERIKAGNDIHMSEFLYPLLQGYDSVAMDVDLEVGGTDQTFNMMMGRRLMKILKNKEKFVLTTKLLEHPKTGKKLMNKSEGGTINLDDLPTDLFGKVMALDDVSMFPVAELCTEMPLERVNSLEAAVDSGKINPRDAKLEAAEWVVCTLRGEKAAKEEKKKWENLFSKKETPLNAPILKLKSPTASAMDLVLASGAAKSKSEARRLVKQGGLKIDGRTTRDPEKILNLKGGEIAKIGKHRFFRMGL